MTVRSTAGDTGTTREGMPFREALAYIRPKPDEMRWQEIPWQTDLWEARRLASSQDKPIFLWAMNGNPLGCT
jgi:hypothetical protein